MKKIALGVVTLAVAFSFSVAGAANYNFMSDLTLGSTGADVTALQSMLVAKGYLVMPAGVAYGYFGGLTQSAVAKLQMANAITPASGYFGPITRAKVNTWATDGGATGGSPSTPGSLGDGEASLEDFELSSGDDADVEEGASGSIAEIEFDVEDGDIQLNRVDLQLVADGANEEEDPWDTFDSLTLSVDGKEIGDIDLSDEDEYLDEDEGTIRVSGLNTIFKEGDTANIAIELTAQNSIDGAEEGNASWTITVLDDGIRATDGEGIEQYVGDDSDSVDFDIVVEGDGEELRVSSSDETPESDTLKVEDDSKSDMFDIFAFDIEAEESDIEFNTVDVNIDVTVGTSTVTKVISDLVLEIDGEEFSDWEYVSGSTTQSAVVRFDIDGDYTLDADSEVVAVLKAEFKAANNVNYVAGSAVTASIDAGDIDAEGADDLTSVGSANGEEMTIADAGIVVVKAGFSDEGSTSNNDENTSRDYEFTFEVTAFEEDFYIATSSIEIFVEGIGSATSSFTVDSTGDEDTDGVFTVNEGDTETFTVVVTISDVSASGQYRVGLDSVDYTQDEDGVSDTEEKDVTNSDFRTAYKTINN